MDISEINELYYITHVDNLRLISQFGILSHNSVKRIPHKDLSSEVVQDRRDNKKLPDTNYNLHHFANLYFDARNPMLYFLTCHNKIEDICILSLSKEVLLIPDSVITDRNAASDWACFKPSPEGLQVIDREITFAKNWNLDNEFLKMEYKSKKCAELLIPVAVNKKYIQKIYVANNSAEQKAMNVCNAIPIIVNNELFFNKG